MASPKVAWGAKGGFQLCPLCGFEFQTDDTLCRHGCPLRSHCGLIRCPGCGYEFADRPSGILGRIRSLIAPREAWEEEVCALVPLRTLRAGARAEVVSVRESRGDRRSTLAVYGLVPGAEIEVVQRTPAVVVRIGETELALDPAIADEILVREPPGDPKSPAP